MEVLDIARAFKLWGFFGVLFGVLWLEHVRPFRRLQERKRRWIVNGKLTVLNILFSAVLPISVVTAAALADANDFGVFNRTDLPIAVVVVASLLFRSLISYVAHYLSHKVPLFWIFHRIHHLDSDIDVTTTIRFHPFDTVLMLCVGVPVTLLMGLDPIALALYEAARGPINVLSHANIRLPRVIDAWINYVLVTATLHRVHHSSDQRFTDSNFSDLCPIWDLVFGTYRLVPLERQRTMELGLGSPLNPEQERLSWLLWPMKGESAAPSNAEALGASQARE